MSTASARMGLIPIKELNLDQEITAMATQTMGSVVRSAEGMMPRIGCPHGQMNAKRHLVAQMFTDAIFNQDIRTITQIISRVDGGLPTDKNIDEYQTLFGDCMNEVLSCTDGSQLQVRPSDTVMMALCKSIYDLAAQDIYFDAIKNKQKKPTPEKKQAKDAALRLVLERAGGRKTQTAAPKQESKTVLADWISEALPDGKDEETPVEQVKAV